MPFVLVLPSFGDSRAVKVSRLDLIRDPSNLFVMLLLIDSCVHVTWPRRYSLPWPRGSGVSQEVYFLDSLQIFRQTNILTSSSRCLCSTVIMAQTARKKSSRARDIKNRIRIVILLTFKTLSNRSWPYQSLNVSSLFLYHMTGFYFDHSTSCRDIQHHDKQ